MENKNQMGHLIECALGGRRQAYAPYSKFQVGCSVLCEDGRIFTGCNIENVSYPAGLCAERVAIFKAVSEGAKKLKSIVVAGGKEGQVRDFCYPCGMCRQVMREFCDPKTLTVVVAKSTREYKVYTLDQLLPESFGPETF